MKLSQKAQKVIKKLYYKIKQEKTITQQEKDGDFSLTKKNAERVYLDNRLVLEIS